MSFIKIPSSLAPVLPMWECSNPKCGHIFKVNSLTHCPLCGAKHKPASKATIENAVLIHFCKIAKMDCPALFTHKERSDFAHNLLAPALTEDVRAILYRFFTTFIDSGWEAGDADDGGIWDDSSGSAVASPVYAGSYAFKCDEGESAEAYSVGDVSDMFMRYYVRVTDVTSWSQLGWIHNMAWSEAVTWGIEAGEWWLDDDSGSSTGGSASVDTWYCVEIRRKTGSGTGIASLSVNGSVEINLTSRTISGNSGNIKVGFDCDNGSADAYFDCVIVADTGPVGCLGDTYTKTFTVGATIQKTYTKTFTAGARVIWQKLKTFTAGARIVAQKEKTFTVGATVQKTYTKSLTVGARIVYQKLKTFTAGARVIWQKNKTFTAGATIQKTQTKTFTVGATIRHELTDQAFAVIHTNKLPDKGSEQFTAYLGGNLKLEDYGSNKINSTKIFLSHVPWSHFDSIYKEAEEATLGSGVDVVDVAGDVLESARLDAQNETMYWELSSGLPTGRYIVLIRAKDTNQVADDFLIQVRNVTDATYLNEENLYVKITLTSDWAYYQMVFDITDEDDGDACRVYVNKDKADANTIYVDHFIIIPVSNGESWIQDVVDTALRRSGQKFIPVKVD